MSLLPLGDRCRLQLQYLDPEGRWCEVQMHLSDAIYFCSLLGRTLDSINKEEAHLVPAIRKRLREVYSELGE